MQFNDGATTTVLQEWQKAPENNDTPPDSNSMDRLEKTVKDAMLDKWGDQEKSKVEQDVSSIVTTENREIALAKKEYANDEKHLEVEEAAGYKVSDADKRAIAGEKADEEQEENQVTEERAKIIALMEEADLQIDMLKRNRSAFSPTQIEFLKKQMDEVELQLRKMSDEENDEMRKLAKVEDRDEEEANEEWSKWEKAQRDQDSKEEEENREHTAGTLVIVVVIVVVMGGSICAALILVDKTMAKRVETFAKQNVQRIKDKLSGSPEYTELNTGDLERGDKELAKLNANDYDYTVTESAEPAAPPDRSKW